MRNWLTIGAISALALTLIGCESTGSTTGVRDTMNDGNHMTSSQSLHDLAEADRVAASQRSTPMFPHQPMQPELEGSKKIDESMKPMTPFPPSNPR